MYALTLVASKFFFKTPKSKYFRLFRPFRVFCNYIILLLLYKGSHKQYIKEWAWLIPRKLYLQEQSWASPG